jgi:hypothetical protein
MLEVNNFSDGFCKVSHTLKNDWNWDKIYSLVDFNYINTPTYYNDLGNGGFTIGGIENFDPLCSDVLKFLKSKKPNYYSRASIYVSTLSNSKSFPLHNDPGQYLWIWQIAGETPWVVDNKNIILKENEMLYISPGLYHMAVPDSPRSSITFSLEEFE